MITAERNKTDFKLKNAITAMFIGSFDCGNYKFKRDTLTLAFENIHLFSEDDFIKKFLDDILNTSLILAKKRKDELYLRRHKAFIMRYFHNMTLEGIGKEVGVNGTNVAVDLKSVIDKMMLLTYGSDALILDEESLKETNSRKNKSKTAVVIPKIVSTNLESFTQNRAHEQMDFLNLTKCHVSELAGAIAENDYSKCYFILEKEFVGYAGLRKNDPKKGLLDRLLILHSDYAAYSVNKDVGKRNNLFKMKYIEGLDNSSIAAQKNINMYALYLECREVIKDILFIAYSVKSTEYESRIYGQKE